MSHRVRILAFLTVIGLTVVALVPVTDAGPAAIPNSSAVHGHQDVGDSYEGGSLPVPSLTPPVTRIETRGTLGLQGWYVTPVLVILTATDDVEVTSTWYRVDSGPYQLYGLPFSINDDRNHTVEFFSLDREENAETPKTARIPVDRNPPIFLDVRPLGTVNSENVLLQWNAEDPASGVARSEVSVDGGAFQNVGPQRSTPVQLSNGRHTVRLRAYDLAGNNASTEYAFQVDTSFLSVTGPQGTILLALIVGVNAAAVLAVLILRRRRRP